MWMLAGALMATVSGAQAAFSATELAMMEADAWRARMGFHLLSIRGDNPEDRDALRQLLDDGQGRVAELKGQAEGEEVAQASAFDTAWDDLSKRALDNPLASLGYADYGAMSEMNTTTLAVAELVEKADPGEPEGAYLDIAELSVSMQRLASEYLALAAFPSAGMPTGTGLPPMDFAIEAKSIDDQLESLKGRYASDVQASEVLAFVEQRWVFVRNTIPRMNENDANKVPYLFYRYATQVAERVEELVAP
ncbi:MAG: hypothetical protein ACJAUN_000871 [Alcanivorax sp.]|jgi:hypothetical protein|nr:hypothetical protein [Alcanivorax sp.]MAC14401.1 hypothetical protein [Alcanivorax sp.]|tara:strand:- start:459 stop:1208 length:750 start_codon:yes stop_codon:yes gene_type:complete